MKKVLVVLLVLFVGAGLFAQELTPYGSLRLDFGGKLTNDGTDNTGEYLFDAQNSGTGLGLRFTSDNFEGDINWSPGNYGLGFTGHGKVTLAEIVSIEAGADHLPAAYWAGLPFEGDGLYSIGATSLGQAPYFKIGAFGAYLGAAAPDLSNLATNGRTPVFFLGYDLKPESNVFNVGVSFTGQSTKSPISGDNKFPILVTLRGLVHPTETIEIKGNVGLYMTPVAFELITPVLDYDRSVPTFAAHDKALVVEGNIGAGFAFTETLALAVAFGGKGDLSNKDDGGGASKIKAGLSAQIKLGDNFSISPGLNFFKTLATSRGGTADGFSMEYGASLGYSF